MATAHEQGNIGRQWQRNGSNDVEAAPPVPAAGQQKSDKSGVHQSRTTPRPHWHDRRVYTCVGLLILSLVALGVALWIAPGEVLGRLTAGLILYALAVLVVLIWGALKLCFGLCSRRDKNTEQH